MLNARLTFPKALARLNMNIFPRAHRPHHQSRGYRGLVTLRGEDPDFGERMIAPRWPFPDCEVTPDANGACAEPIGNT
jgi:hypothetical protein